MTVPLVRFNYGSPRLEVGRQEMLRRCNHCETLVLPMAEGLCPACGRTIDLQTAEAVPVETTNSEDPDVRIWRMRQAEHSPEVPKARSLGGWLILPAIGVVLGPAQTLGAIGLWFEVLGGARNGAIDDRIPEINIVIAALTLVLLFQAFVAVAFFRKKRYVPGMIVVYLVSQLALTIVFEIWTASMVAIDSRGAASIAAFMAAAIWIPYFLKSRRVKETFVHE